MANIEAVGDVVTGGVGSGGVAGGGVSARAVAPQPVDDGHTHESACLNCGAALGGPYCQQCGQQGHVHRTIAAFFHDLAHGVFHFEGKTWHTLPLLAWRPGELTRRYVEGQRARFVSPMALFLFSVFLMFAVVSQLAPLNVHDVKGEAEIQANAAANERRLVDLQHQRAVAAAAGADTAALDARIKNQTDDANLMREIAHRGVIGGANNVSGKMPSWLRDSVQKAVANPDFTVYKLKSSAYKWSWGLIPLSLPFLWLLFPFDKRFRLYDHIVFVTYSLSFMTLLVVVLSLAAAVSLPGIAPAAMFIPPVHMYRQLKGAYRLSRAGALWRAALLSVGAIVTLSLFVSLMVLVGLLD